MKVLIIIEISVACQICDEIWQHPGFALKAIEIGMIRKTSQKHGGAGTVHPDNEYRISALRGIVANGWCLWRHHCLCLPVYLGPPAEQDT